MGKRDKLREFIYFGIECYELGASPPAIHYPSMSVDDNTDSIPYMRTILLQIGIDTKYMLSNYLATLPEKRAKIFHQWLLDGSNYAEYSLSYYQRHMLKEDRRAFRLIIKDKLFR